MSCVSFVTGGPSTTVSKAIAEIKQRGRCGRLENMKRYEAQGRIQQEESKASTVVLAQANDCAVQLPTLVQDALR
eukprot:9854165-Karenia_brevis.AAC.1